MITKTKILIGSLAAMLGLGTVGGVLCARRQANQQEHLGRIDAQVALERAETKLDLPAEAARARARTAKQIRELNTEVRAPVQEVDDDLDRLAGALNGALGIP